MSAVINLNVKKKPSGSGRICAIYKCSNSQLKQFVWRHDPCAVHEGMSHDDCPCLIPFSLHNFPKSEELRREWVKAVNRKNYTPGKNAKICSVHFIDGFPSKENPVPQLSLGYEKKVIQGRKPLQRKNTVDIPISNTQKSKRFIEDVPVVHESTGDETVSRVSAIPEQQATKDLCPIDVIHSVCDEHIPYSCTSDEFDRNTIACQTDHILVRSLKHASSQTGTILKVDSETQWVDLSIRDHDYCTSPTSANTKLHNNIATQANIPEICFSNLSQQDALFYTGLQLNVLVKLLAWLTPHASKFTFRMNLGDQFLMVLIRLRLALLFYDLGRRFGTSTSVAVQICSEWLSMMATQMKKVIFWLPRETIVGSMPECFRSFPKTTCIIDCSEVFIHRPLVLRARAQTYSNYKSHNTAKFLIAVAPNGFIMFLSKCFGGRASDKLILNESGFLNYVLPGDEIMADRGFTVEEEIAMKGASLNIPCFTKNKIQLSESEVTGTRRIASVRIHVERAIGRIKEYKILKHPSAFHKGNKNIDNIVFVCAALTNLKPLLIKHQFME